MDSADNTGESPRDPGAVVEQFLAMVSQRKEAIEAHVAKIGELELLDGGAKEDLMEPMRKIHSALCEMEPIAQYVSETNKVILEPVIRNIDSAFTRSNRWGIRGIVVSVVSLVVSAVLGVIALLQAEPHPIERLQLALLGPSERSTISENLRRAFAEPTIQRLVCDYPKISDHSPIIAYGRDLVPCVVRFAGIDLFIATDDNRLVEIPTPLPPVLPGQEPLLRISGTIPVVERGEDRYAYLLHPPTLGRLLNTADAPLSDSWREIGVLASDAFNNETWERIRAKVPHSLPSDRLVHTTQEGTREAVWEIPQPRRKVTPLWSLPARVTLGDEQNYFGSSSPQGVSHYERFELEHWPPLGSGDLGARIVVVGIGPGKKNSRRETSLVVNGHIYGLLRHSPFKGMAHAHRWRSSFLVPLQPAHLRSGLNQIEFRAGEDPASDGRIGLDDVIIEELDLFYIERDLEAPSKPDLG